jgi:transposase-like protein
MPKPTYSPEFKRKVVEEHFKGGKSVAAICREYHVGEVAFRRWRAQCQAAASQSAQGQAELARELTAAQRRIEELEGALGRATLEVDFMKRCFKRAGLPFPSAPKS